MAEGPLARATSLVELLSRAGLLDPRRIPALSFGLARWGPTLAAPFAASAIVHPTRPAVIDDDGELGFFRLDRDSTATAMGLHRLGLHRGDDIAVACRNHRQFLEITVAAAKAGLGVVYMNTSFGGPQMNEVLARESVAGLVVDAGLLDLIDVEAFHGLIVVTDLAAVPDIGPSELPIRTVAIDHVRDHRPLRLPLRPSLPVAPILLTSGTTGTPKGARRASAGVDSSAASGLFERIPYRHDDVIAITSPMFHAWGFAQLALAAILGCTVTVSRRFDADDTLRRVEADRATVLAVVPAILQRLLAAPRLADSDLSTLRIVASSGSALPVPVVEEWLERVGPNLYNLYGSTEVGQASIATPDELLVEPATAGRVIGGSVVAILDDDGAELPAGEIGRVFVGNEGQFDHYTGGGGKEIVDGLMSSGDVGYLRDDGLLFVTGRADDMIVSGGENVFPQEVENLLLSHPEIADAAVVGVADESLGQRLVAHVVLAEGSSLTSDEIRRHVSATLARHKTPRDVHLVDELPRTATGKLRRRDLTS